MLRRLADGCVRGIVESKGARRLGAGRTCILRVSAARSLSAHCGGQESCVPAHELPDRGGGGGACPPQKKRHSHWQLAGHGRSLSGTVRAWKSAKAAAGQHHASRRPQTTQGGNHIALRCGTETERTRGPLLVKVEATSADKATRDRRVPEGHSAVYCSSGPAAPARGRAGASVAQAQPWARRPWRAALFKLPSSLCYNST